MPGNPPVVLDPEAQQLAAKREAFLAAERARRGAEPAGDHGDLLPPSARPPRPRPERSLFMAYVWWFILAQISAHRFYLGANKSAIAQVCTFLCWLLLVLAGPPATFVGFAVMAIWIIWIFADAFLIPGLHRKYQSGASHAVQIVC